MGMEKQQQKQVTPKQNWKKGLQCLQKCFHRAGLSLSSTPVNLVPCQQPPPRYSTCPSTFFHVFSSFHCWHVSAIRYISSCHSLPSGIYIKLCHSRVMQPDSPLHRRDAGVMAKSGSDGCRVHCKRNFQPKGHTYLGSVWRIKRAIWEGPENREAKKLAVG